MIIIQKVNKKIIFKILKIQKEQERPTSSNRFDSSVDWKLCGREWVEIKRHCGLLIILYYFYYIIIVWCISKTWFYYTFIRLI